MKVRFRVILGIFSLLAGSCGLQEEQEGIHLKAFSYDFGESDHGWQVGFADYAAADSVSFQLKSAYTHNPYNAEKSIMVSGANQSADLFMFLKKKVSGLQPNSTYKLSVEVELASNAPAGNFGSTGQPGESVFLKAGATAFEPKSENIQGRYVINVDKGNHEESGNDMHVIGNIATELTSADTYSLVTRSNVSSAYQPFTVTTDSAGELWLIVGTDSGFGGTTTVYYTRIHAVLTGAK